jgi:hypothetical protein
MAVYTYFTGLEGNDNGPVGNNQGFKKKHYYIQFQSY